MESSDEHLVEQAKRDDLSAFEKLVHRYQRKIYSIAYQMTNNHSDADDVAQETFIRAYTNLRGFKGQSSFYTWIYRILINCCTDHLRKHRRRREYELNESLDVSKYADALASINNSPGALREAELCELRKAVADTLDSLPAKHRTVVVLHDLSGLPHRDIAKIMGCSEGTVRSRLHYARLKMQKRLRKYLK